MGNRSSHGDQKRKDDNEVKECQPDTREEPNRSSDEEDHKVSPLTERSILHVNRLRLTLRLFARQPTVAQLKVRVR